MKSLKSMQINMNFFINLWVTPTVLVIMMNLHIYYGEVIPVSFYFLLLSSVIDRRLLQLIDKMICCIVAHFLSSTNLYVMATKYNKMILSIYKIDKAFENFLLDRTGCTSARKGMATIQATFIRNRKWNRNIYIYSISFFTNLECMTIFFICQLNLILKMH